MILINFEQLEHDYYQSDRKSNITGALVEGGSEHRNTAKKLTNPTSRQEKSMKHRHWNIYF